MSRSQQSTARGFLLPSAIFLLVILAALGAFIVNVSTSQHLGMALDIKGERAWQAANAGMEWVRYKLASNPGSPSCPVNVTPWPSTSASSSLSFTNTTTLTDFYATVECNLLTPTTPTPTDVQGIQTWVFEVRVTACSPAAAAEPRCPGTPTATGYAERQLQGLIAF